tara:strand:+ start:1684 stop:2427 length:744 start_codon:yes stop_codon:yes gene_type:complete
VALFDIYEVLIRVGTSRSWLVLILIAVAIVIVISVGIFLLTGWYPDVIERRDKQIFLTHSFLWIGLICATSIFYKRITFLHSVRYGGVWITIGMGLVLAYSFRHEMQSVGERLYAELVPHAAISHGDVVVVRAGMNGHFLVEADVDNTTVKFLVDTGASDVVLSPRDAKRVGIDFSALDFNKVYQTANGSVKGAPFTIDRLTIGSLTIEDVRASVNGAHMNRSLLGMSFLGRLTEYQVRHGKLFLHR